MITALQIGLLLVLIALIGIILGYLFGKLSCKKQADDLYFNKNEYCENEYLSSSTISSDFNDEQPSILSSENVAKASENSVETLLNNEPQSVVAQVSDEVVPNDKNENNKLDTATFVDDSISNSSSNEKEKQSLVADSEKVDTKDNEDEHKPNVLTVPRDNKADNLCRIKGIGFVIEEKLHNLGVFHFDQIAAWSEKEIAWVDSHLAFSGRIKREDWIGQAQKLATGEETEFSKRVDKGNVSTSRKTTDKEKA